MAFTKAALVRNTLALLIVGLAALIFILGATWFLVEKTTDYSDDIFAERRARSSVVDFLTLMQQAETSQRGYLLDQQDDYLRPFLEARDQLPEQLNRVRERFATTPQRQRTARILENLYREKITELEETVQLARNGQMQLAFSRLRTDTGLHTMDAIRQQIAASLQEADAELARLAESQRSYGSALRFVALGGGLVILLVALGAAWTAFRYMQELALARSELEALNTDLEARVRERTEELATANEEIQRFAYIVTHDLRAPLVNVMGFTSELQTSLEPIQALADDPAGASPPMVEAAQQAAREDLPEAIDFIRASTRKMDGLINAILRLSREGRRVRKPETLDLAGLIAAASAAIQHQLAEADGEIATDLALSQAVTDRLSLEQIVGNILDNAVKYRDRSRPLRITIRTRPRGLHAFTLEIEDNGRGIDGQDHGRIFELFRRSGMQDQTGEGIGLAHVKTLVRNLGGTISVNSELGKGTAFTIHLPRDLRDYLGKITESHAA